MTIKIWNSYSCNNSSSFRLVAKFASPGAAAAGTDGGVTVGVSVAVEGVAAADGSAGGGVRASTPVVAVSGVAAGESVDVRGPGS